MNHAQATGIAIVLLTVALVGALTIGLDRLLHRVAQPDVGLEVFAEDCTMLGDEEEAEEEPSLPPIEEDRVAMRLGVVPLGIELAYYGTRVVHRQCLEARRDGLVACSSCAAILTGVTL